MEAKTPLRAVDLAEELGKDKRTVLNWLKNAYENKSGIFSGLRIRKEDFNGNVTYLIDPSDWDAFKSDRTVGMGTNSQGANGENEGRKHNPYMSQPVSGGVELSQLVTYLREKDERMYEMITRATAAETQLKLLTDGRTELEKSYEDLRNSHYETVAQVKALEASLAEKEAKLIELEAGKSNKPWWRAW